MNFENAKKGLKQIFGGELLELLSSIAMYAVAFASPLVKENREMSGINGILAAVAAIGLIVAMITSGLASILRLLGVANSGKDEGIFKGAFVTVAANLILSLLNTQLQNWGLSASLLNTIKSCLNTLTMIFVVTGIINLAKTVENEEAQTAGTKSLTYIILVEVLVLAVNIITKFITEKSELFWIPAAIAVVSLILSLISYFVYLKALKKGSQML